MTYKWFDCCWLKMQQNLFDDKMTFDSWKRLPQSKHDVFHGIKFSIITSLLRNVTSVLLRNTLRYYHYVIELIDIIIKWCASSRWSFSPHSAVKRPFFTFNDYVIWLRNIIGLNEIPVLFLFVFDLETSLGSIWSDWIWFVRPSICSEVIFTYCSVFVFDCWWVRFLILLMIWTWVTSLTCK